jgi:molybdopterin-containing oxidoreductase family iron-sulfur binding subunit
MSKRVPYVAREPWPGSPAYWRSLEERGRLGDPALRAESSVEFQKGHFETPPSDEALQVSRRGLLGAMAATFSAIGAEGCRRPLERIVPYTKMPEDVIPGVPSHYSTVLARRGDALGLIVESHEGRPTKVEGNEGHPASQGSADMVTQAAILDLYDPERSTTPRKSGTAATWVDFEQELGGRLAAFDEDQGARLRVLMPPTLSPTVIRMRAALAQRFPKARVHTWSAVNDSNAREGTRLAFGQPMTPLYSFDKARVILSLDSDFLQTESGNVRATKQFASGRRLRSSRDPMSRLYVVEPSPTTTGANADHRLRLRASDIERYAYALAAELAKKGVGLGSELDALVARHGNSEGIPPKWLATVSKDLASNRRNAFVVVGSRQPPRLHAVGHALNMALGAVDSVVHFVPVTDPDELDASTDLKALVGAIDAGQVEALVILGGNPVYDAPADLSFGAKIAKVPLTVHASLHYDETSEKATWHVPRAHEFESWGDAHSLDGTVSVQQPLIAPLYAGRSDIELLALLANATQRTGHDAVRTTALAEMLASRGFTCGPFVDEKAECRDGSGKSIAIGSVAVDREWSRALATGVLARAKSPPRAGALRLGDIAAAVDAQGPPRPAASEAFEVTFAPCPKMVDGRHANNTWLQEVPDPVTKIVWDNAAIVSPATARALGVANKDMVRISVGDRSIAAAVWIVPGQVDQSIALTLGWGRTGAGRIGNGRGFDAYPLRTGDALGFAVGASVSKTGADPYFFAQTQEHDSTENRPIAHEATLAEYRVKGNFAELETPPQRALPLWSQVDYSKGHQWGMSIDLNACTGCSACVVACMSENNVPVVGKTEVWRGREMLWLRIDRYWVEDPKHGATADQPLTIHEPVMCVHCEEAPCENVCPVNATTHGPEGLNEMAYNRCIGTRYCANNCPYKVRRFNYLNWHNDSVWKDTGGLPETLQMQQNPNVTVRFRGVMEKCTYCVQRIQSAKIRAKREYRELRDGEIRTACQQTCPADAIVFGDVNDPKSQVTTWSRTDRRFGLLAELGTRPRTTYLGKVRNLNPEMA